MRAFPSRSGSCHHPDRYRVLRQGRSCQPPRLAGPSLAQLLRSLLSGLPALATSPGAFQCQRLCQRLFHPGTALPEGHTITFRLSIPSVGVSAVLANNPILLADPVARQAHHWQPHLDENWNATGGATRTIAEGTTEQEQNTPPAQSPGAVSPASSTQSFSSTEGDPPTTPSMPAASSGKAWAPSLGAVRPKSDGTKNARHDKT